MTTKSSALIAIHQIVRDHINQLYLQNFSTIKDDIRKFQIDNNVGKSATDFSDGIPNQTPPPRIFTPTNPKRKDCK